MCGLEKVLAGKGRHRHQAGAVWMAVGEGWVKAELWRVRHSFISPGITLIDSSPGSRRPAVYQALYGALGMSSFPTVFSL